MRLEIQRRKYAAKTAMLKQSNLGKWLMPALVPGLTAFTFSTCCFNQFLSCGNTVWSYCQHLRQMSTRLLPLRNSWKSRFQEGGHRYHASAFCLQGILTTDCEAIRDVCSILHRTFRGVSVLKNCCLQLKTGSSNITMSFLLQLR